MAKQKNISPVSNPVQKEKVKKTSSTFDISKYLDWGHLIILAIVFFAAYTYIYDEKQDMNGDNFGYLVLAQRLAAGLGYTNSTDHNMTLHTHFPPAYPFLMSLFLRLGVEDFAFFNQLNGAFFLGMLFIFYFIVKKLTSSSSLAFVGVLIVSLNVPLLRSATMSMSEIPFLFFVMLGIFFFIKIPASLEENEWLNPFFWFSIIVLAICYYFRSLGISLLAGAGLYLLFAKKWKALAAVIVGYGLLILPWYLRNRKLGSSYGGQFIQVNPYKPELGNLTMTTFLQRIKENINSYISVDIPSSIFNLDKGNVPETPWSWWFIGICLLVLLVWGIYNLKDFRLFFVGFIAAYLTILLVWPGVWGGGRFIQGVLPFLIVFPLIGFKKLIDSLLKKIGLAFEFPAYIFAVACLFMISPLEKLNATALEKYPPYFQNFIDVSKWAKVNTPKNAQYSCRKPNIFSVYADRICTGDKPSLDDKEVMQFFRDQKVNYVIIEQLGYSSTAKYLVPAVQKNMDKFDVVYQTPAPETYLLRFKDVPLPK